MDAPARTPGAVPPLPLRRGAADQATATLELLRAWSVEDPTYDRETVALLTRGLQDEPLAFAPVEDDADRPR